MLDWWCPLLQKLSIPLPYVLIAFVAISLIVSSIMIGVITLISVQERTKEIGILRAIGASKRDVSSMFNAETIIIGFTSGLLGVLVTYLLCIPINLLVHYLTNINNVLLTLIAGFIPSKSAAKKDPVVALRSEWSIDFKNDLKMYHKKISHGLIKTVGDFMLLPIDKTYGQAVL